MTCEKYLNLIQDFIENELDAQIADEVSLHIFACPHCENEFENLTREKEIYSQFLFEIEPPKNLSQRFQARLENEIEAKNILSVSPVSFGERFKNLFSWRNLLPATAAVCVLLLFGLSLFWLKNSANETAKTNDSSVGKSDQPLPLNDSKKESAKENSPQEFKSETAKVVTKPSKNFEKVLFEKIKTGGSKREKSGPVKVGVKTPKNLENSAAEKTPGLSEEEKLRIRELQAFETETAKQMEKIEMLLRSFRNARFSEETEQYDVSFEKQQARKLLDATEKLRAQAEFFGDFYTKDTLDKVEPFLLDIANLENNPSTEMVLDIKQRVRNENLIAGLQAF